MKDMERGGEREGEEKWRMRWKERRENGIGFVFVCFVILLGGGGESEKEVRQRSK